jgi:ubiquinone/menaquinone biosynthesis C-methylase UbiE
VGDRQFIGTAREVTDPVVLQTEVLPMFEAAYGKERLSRWFGSEMGCVSLLRSNDGVPHYRAVETLFDQSAPMYDRVVQSNRFDQHLRTVALEVLRTRFRPGDRVLELGCGTGLETIPLAESGVEIVALDISRGMLRELNRKARSASVHGRIKTRQVPISELHKIVSDLGPGSFDGVFSHFGALNCEPHLDSLSETLYQLIKPKGRVSLGVWNRTCLAEMVLFGMALRPARALARFQSSVPVGKTRFGVPVFPYSPGEVKRLFSPFFSFESAVGASVLMPPYNLTRRLVPHPQLIGLLEAGDRLIRDRPFLRYLGDHFLLELRRR